MAGSLLVYALFLRHGHRITTSLKQSLPLAPLSKALGAFGRQINETVGRICAKGRKYFKKPNELALAGEASQLGAAKELWEHSTNLLRQDSQFTAGVDAAKLAKLVEFEVESTKLIVKYGEEVVQEAKKVINACENKILGNHLEDLLKELEMSCKEVKVVFDKGDHKFIYDAAKGGKATVGSVREALAARAAEDQGICKHLTRSIEATYDFLDETGRKWDVKALESEYILDLDFTKYINKVKKNIDKGEYILFDISRAEAEHVETLNFFLNSMLSANEKSKISFVNYKNLIK